MWHPIQHLMVSCKFDVWPPPSKVANIKQWQLRNDMILYSQILGDQIVFVTRPDKKRILFYNDKSYSFSVDEGQSQSLMLNT